MNLETTVCAAPVQAGRRQGSRKSPIPVRCRQRNRFIPAFLLGVAALSVLSLLYLEIDWLKMLSRVPDIGGVFWALAHLDGSNLDLILSALVETISIAVLSLLYSLLLGIVFGMLAARNIFRIPALSVFTQSFFTKSFAQSFESIPQETIEALEVTGAGRLSIFCNAVLPAALPQIVAWAGMRLEVNFSECAILGMVGAGGVGYVISTSLQGYDYGTAGVAILLVFVVAYCIERIFVRIKKKFN